MSVLHGIRSNEGTFRKVIQRFDGKKDETWTGSRLIFFQTFLPIPPIETEAATSDTATPDFQFSFIECLMYALHQLSRKYPDFLIAEENEERVKDFRLRLRYLYRGASSYTTQLKSTLNGKTEGDEQDEQVISFSFVSK